MKSNRMSDHEKRQRSPNWTVPERELLLSLVEEHYSVIECKRLDGATLRRKHAEWALIARKYNARTTLPERTGKVLRGQWAALRKFAKKDELRRLESGDGPHTKNPLHDRIVRLIQTKLNDPDSYDKEGLPAMQDDDSEDVSLPSCSKESKDQKFNTSTFDSKADVKNWDCNTADDSGGDSEKTKRSTVFSARDCRLLLHCVRQEKNVLFTNSPLVRKQKAWDRITRAFNRQSPTKISPPELKKKFQNLKSMVSKVNKAKCFTVNKRKKYEELSNEDGFNKKIKLEPKSDGTDDFDFENDEDDGDGLDAGRSSSNGSVHSDANHDPLSNGIGVDSGLGLINHSDNKELDKLKLELLSYELETAKLQRKRLEDAIEGEKSARDLRALETSLRIRAARLEVLAAESKIPPLHPALVYTPEETRARQYLQKT